ncbi:GNAT family N-acetyltransferase [Lignipirellula cremea]|uniref:Putative N-acetyltransferase YafP n=1 Tax=Lignipirellula cremea TaxID=2528010 RepID=A0A518E282_9BACT|nr:GNAT family N-acetyltransferase [Lignipirellula cremea]QDU98206.1 putative N-acetyltransferase YafP [Lignipirellula cremea]
MTLLLRKALPDEAEALWLLFYNTIHNVNRRDYSAEQTAAWAPAEMDPAAWRRRIAGMDPYVCLDSAAANGSSGQSPAIVGYAGMTATENAGYIDHFYVHHQWQGQGVGKLLYQQLEADAVRLQLSELTSDVSITARPFFESRGFQVVTPQQVERAGVILANFRMKKRLPADR